MIAQMREYMSALTLFLEDGVRHYEKCAPTVSRYLDDLFIRIGDTFAVKNPEQGPSPVTLAELLGVASLKDDSGWIGPNYAANTVYKLMSRLGMDTTGHAGF